MQPFLTMTRFNGSSMLGVVLAVARCTGTLSNRKAVALPRDVQLLTREEMNAWCHAVDPEDACQDFRDPPADVVARFEARLPELLKAKGRGHVAPHLKQYLRQYWAVRENGELRIVGNFVCRSHVEDTRQAWDELYAALGESPGKSIGPVVVDDAGGCKVTALFPAERVEDAEFP